MRFSCRDFSTSTISDSGMPSMANLKSSQSVFSFQVRLALGVYMPVTSLSLTAVVA
ncbi:hypothetical protein D3C87_1949880 [compost metagenome]